MGKLKRSRSAAPTHDDIVVTFNIDAIPAADKQPLLENTRALRSGLIQVAYTLLDAGEKFTRWKERLPHGAYLPWVATTGYSEQSARDACNVYKRFRDTPQLFSDLDLALPETAIVRLSTAPETAMEDVIDRVREGEALDLKTVTTIIDQHKKAYRGTTSPRSSKPSPRNLGAHALRRMAEPAIAELADATEHNLVRLLHFIVEAEGSLPTKHRYSLRDLELGGG